jgi:hypothetical protein
LLNQPAKRQHSSIKARLKRPDLSFRPHRRSLPLSGFLQSRASREKRTDESIPLNASRAARFLGFYSPRNSSKASGFGLAGVNDSSGD